jgi:hypothetical protein
VDSADDRCLVLTLAGVYVTPGDAVLVYDCDCGRDCGATLYVRKCQAFFTSDYPVLCGDFPLALVNYQREQGDTARGESRPVIHATCLNDLDDKE